MLNKGRKSLVLLNKISLIFNTWAHPVGSRGQCIMYIWLVWIPFISCHTVSLVSCPLCITILQQWDRVSTFVLYKCCFPCNFILILFLVLMTQTYSVWCSRFLTPFQLVCLCCAYTERLISGLDVILNWTLFIAHPNLKLRLFGLKADPKFYFTPHWSAKIYSEKHVSNTFCFYFLVLFFAL